ncbi:MAG TPA: aminotransferase class IV [Mycobacteriales bacterium]|nr:aminotransferase class IV [Mycobacteriales bacterium]
MTTSRLLGVLGAGLVDPTAPLLRAEDLGVLRGDGCFESIRVRAPTAVGRDAVAGANRLATLDGFDEHLERLACSAAALDLPATDAAAWRDLTGLLLAAWDRTGEAVLRLVLTRGVEGDDGRPTGFAVLSPVPAEHLRQRAEGVRAVTLSRGLTADATVEAPWLLGGVKATSYAVNMAALRYARSTGAEDAIFVSVDGQVLEAPTASVVWLTGRVLQTPPPRPLGVLDSVTVRALFARAAGHGFGTEIRRAAPEDLHAADGVWLVSSIRVAAAVTTLDGKSLRTDPATTARVHAAAGV